MQLSGAPAQLVLPWANGDSSKTNPIPVPSQIGVTPGAASWTDGFPPLCATPVISGGVPPAKADMNGGLYQMSAVDVWLCAGGGFPYSSAFSAAIGGYPKGARVLAATGLWYWHSNVDNNTTDPDTGGAGWSAVGTPTSAQGVGSQAGEYSTGNTAFTVVDGANLASTVTIPLGWKFLVTAAGAVSQATANGGVYVGIVDSVVGVVTRVALNPYNLSGWMAFAMDAVIVGDGASHTVNLQFATGVSSYDALIQNSSTGYPVMTFCLTPSN